MQTEKFQAFVKLGNFTKGERDAKFLAALGLNGEAGEVSELIKKHLLHGKELNRDDLIKELGDVLWYFFHALNAFDVSIDEVVTQNVTKLCARYPAQYGKAEDWIVTSVEQKSRLLARNAYLNGAVNTRDYPTSKHYEDEWWEERYLPIVQRSEYGEEVPAS
jgi:NTP pyrophosphatase (non-canonical NTP hydrolase)